jgi:hypothetical protein
MPEWGWLVLVVLALVVGAGAAWFFLERRRTQRLRRRFGPEYEHSVHAIGSRRKAEKELEHREERIQHLDIRLLEPAESDRFLEEWRGVQGRFVDNPAGAVAEADRLVAEVMRARGYPVTDFDQRAADISVDHPRVVENYRAARDIAVRSERGEASTEDLRQAMVHYRILFDDLLESEPTLRKERPA